MLLADLRELRGVLDNLIWKGSELSASMKLKDLDIKDTLKQLEEKWNLAVKRAEKKLIDLDDLRMDWAEREEMLANMESWVVQAEDQLLNEQGLSSRDEDSLRDALTYYEVKLFAVEPRSNEPLYNEVLGITNDISQLGLLKCMEQNLDITNPRFDEPISLFPWHFDKPRFHCIYLYVPHLRRTRYRYKHKAKEGKTNNNKGKEKTIFYFI